MNIIFVSSKDSDETRNMSTKRDNIEVMMSNETEEIIKELFESLLQKYQEGLEESMRENEFIFNSVDLLYYHLQKISLNRKGGSYIDSPKWLKNKKATTNPKNNDDKCFQYTLTSALNYQSHPEGISNLKPFINQYNLKEIDFPAQPSKEWKTFELNNKKIAFNILFAPCNTKEIRRVYKSKHNNRRKNQVILLMITDGENTTILL